jgi:hypothetical protein
MCTILKLCPGAPTDCHSSSVPSAASVLPFFTAHRKRDVRTNMHEHVPSLAARDTLCIWYNTAAFEDTATNIKNGADSSKNVQLFLERWEKIETTYAKSMDELLESRISHMNKNTAAGISRCFTAPHVCIVQRVQLWLCSLLSPWMAVHMAFSWPQYVYHALFFTRVQPNPSTKCGHLVCSLGNRDNCCFCISQPTTNTSLT